MPPNSPQQRRHEAEIGVPEQLCFKGVTSKYQMPEAYKYPLLGAMREAIKVQGRSAKWTTEPEHYQHEKTGRQSWY